MEEGVDATRSPKDLVQLGVGGRGRGEGGQKSWADNTSTNTSTSTSTSTSTRRRKRGLENEHSEKRHFRTFFLAFHHFDEDMAVRVLKDAMEGGDGIG